MLGLFLILLAFFIMLNAISILKEDKFSRVSTSLIKGFGISQGTTLPTQKVQSFLEHHQTVMQYIITLFDENLPNGVQVKGAYQLATFLFIQVDDFFVPHSTKVRAIRAGFFEHLVKHLQQNQTGMQTHIEIDIPTTKGGDDALDLAAFRATAFAQKLINAGMEGVRITPRVVESEEKLVRIKIETIR